MENIDLLTAIEEYMMFNNLDRNNMSVSELIELLADGM